MDGISNEQTLPPPLNIDHLVLCFGKALTQEPLLLHDRNSSWIALGYFDTLQIYPLPMDGSSGSWIQATYLEDLRISQKLDGKFYFHPVHITACNAQASHQRNLQFYLRESAYLAVTFVQEHTSPTAGSSTMEQEIFQALSGHPAQLSWALYHTLNLSDAVILWKSNSLLEILQAIQVLYHLPRVGDLRSVPTISLHTILEEAGAPAAQEETLPLVLTRYLVRSAHWAAQYFQSASADWRETPFLTSGMEDLSTVSQNCSSRALLTHLRDRLTCSSVRTAFQKAFLESEIHLGIAERITAEGDVPENPLTQRCEALLADFLRLPAHNYPDNQDWIKVATELFNALPHMSRSAVSDGFCYLIVESAALFCQEMAHIARPDSSQIRYIQRFLRGWGTLMDQSMRQDGKLSQQPGYSPALCQIPSSLLELYLAFHAQCCQVLRQLTLDRCHFSFLLVPKLCRRIKVEVTIQKAPPCDRLLYVDIPYALLYEPEQVLPHLCHEISHYCGESWRNRHIRKAKLLQICAKTLTMWLQLHHPAAAEAMEHLLQDNVSACPEYLDPMLDAFFKAVQTVLKQEEDLEKVLHAAKCGSPNNQNDLLDSHAQLLKTLAARQEILLAFRDNPGNPKGEFFLLMQEFKELFRECYADISMLFLLDLDEEAYFHLIRNELLLFQRNIAPFDDYDLTVERWAVVAYVVYRADASSLLSLSLDPLVDSFAQDVMLCLNYFYYSDDEILDEFSFDEAMKRFHLPECIRPLTEYLEACRASMEASWELNPQPLIQLRKVFHQIAREEAVFGDTCRKLVETYRAHLLCPLPDAAPTPVGV